MNKALMFKSLFFFALILNANSLIAGPILWISDANGELGTVDVETGEVSVIGYMGTEMTDIAFDPDGNLYAIDFFQFYSVNKATAESTLIGEIGGDAVNSLVFGSDGQLYTASDTLYTIDISTGRGTPIGNGGYPYDSAGDLAFVGGDLLLSSNTEGDDDSLVKINISTGVGLLIGDIGFEDVFGLASPNGTDLFGASSIDDEVLEILSINPATGVGTFILDFAGKGLTTPYGSAFVTESVGSGPSPIPEPTTLALLIFGFTGFCFTRRKIKA
jgi:hypothetical protein